MLIKFTLPDADKLSAQLGINPTGPVQAWHTQNILRRMAKYVPMETGMFLKQMVISSPHTISVTAPQAYYLYYGKRMVNSKTGNGPRWIPGVGWRWPKGATLVATDQPLNYTKTFHPLAGPYWDQRLLAAEGNLIAQELKNYVKAVNNG